LFVIGFICFYNIIKWLKPDQKLEINLTSDIYLNDVSGLNKTRISSIFYPRTVNDIQYWVSKAELQGKTISVRGQAHTMGGHTLPSATVSSMNYVCDLKYMNRVEYDETSEEVLVEVGATWTHVINKLKEYGRSPVVMQSYCTFNVAGTISVNAH
jgi:FAD/FMN-containing dehydrogenase